jgi:hypothetical protein
VSMNLLQMYTAAMGEMGLTAQSTVVSSTDSITMQTLALLNAQIRQMCREFEWNALDTEYRFNVVSCVATGNISLANPTQITGLTATTGTLASISSPTLWQVTGNGIQQDTYLTAFSGTTATLALPATSAETGATFTFCQMKYPLASDYDRQVSRTHYDKSKHWEMMGSMTPQNQEWLRSGYISTGPRIRYWMQGGYFNIWPIINTNDLLGYQYISNAPIVSTGGTRQSSFLADTDTCILNCDDLLIKAIKLKYFSVKGFDITAYKYEFDQAMGRAKANDQPGSILSMAPRPINALIGWEQIPDSNYGT